MKDKEFIEGLLSYLELNFQWEGLQDVIKRQLNKEDFSFYTIESRFTKGYFSMFNEKENLQVEFDSMNGTVMASICRDAEWKHADRVTYYNYFEDKSQKGEHGTDNNS